MGDTSDRSDLATMPRAEALAAKGAADRVRDASGNVLFLDADGAVLCNHGACPLPLSLWGRDEGMASGAYAWACPVHGAPLPPLPCPVCAGPRHWATRHATGMEAVCAACERAEG